MLPPAIEAFAKLPIWTTVFFLLAVAIAAYSGWSFWRNGRRQDLYYLLLGLYLAAVQLPILFPSLGQAIGVGDLVPGSPLSFLLALPALALFVLGATAR